nr:dna-(apurinic or apyrimidinic site) lyase 1 [Quercus suber]
MPKRKLKLEASTDSDLSPPPLGLLDDGSDTQQPRKKTRSRKVAQTRTVTAPVEAEHGNNSKLVVKGKREGKFKDAASDDGDDEPRPVKERSLKTEGQEEDKVELDQDGEFAKKKAVRKRKTKEEKEAESMPLAVRTIGHKLFIGAHVSSAGVDQSRHVVPHGSYLVNLAHTDSDRTVQAYDSFLDDLKRCESLGIKLYNFHPGNSVGGDRQRAIAHLAENINRAHQETKTVITLLENMAAGGNVLGSTFEDLRDIIALVHDQTRVGVCLDTCHAFAAGYDLRSPAAFRTTMQQFDDIIGIQYLRAVHLNDSKAPFKSHRDLHANIGTGFLGLRAFHNLVNDARFEGMPLVLETPIAVRDESGNLVRDEKNKEKEDKRIWAREIKMLEGLVGMEVESEEFRGVEERLQRQGEPERRRLMEQSQRKKEKDEKKKGSGSRKKKRKKGVETEDELESEHEP